eukprot:scaffold31_cov263-Pinguiococcus_pyrenoidosus.AAC.18
MLCAAKRPESTANCSPDEDGLAAAPPDTVCGCGAAGSVALPAAHTRGAALRDASALPTSPCTSMLGKGGCAERPPPRSGDGTATTDVINDEVSSES